MKLRVDGNTLVLDTGEAMNTGTVGWHRAQFAFDGTWTGLAKTAVWRTAYGDWAALLEEDGCDLPWEALDHAAELAVAVFGVGDGVVLTTNYVSLGRVVPGAGPADPAVEPTPAAYETLVELSAHAPRIGADGTWEVWSIGDRAYGSTGVSAAGSGGAVSITNTELEELLK